ncbi:hypothetical protein A6E25_21745 [Bacillus cereus]|nr:hypothetical protein A6E25_21745 [Bacillus cereus]
MNYILNETLLSGTTKSYTYDGFGNRTSVKVVENGKETKSIEATCPCCSKSMNYVAMLTGEDYGNEGGLTGGITFQIGESFLYFYLCKECLIIQTSMQSA